MSLFHARPPSVRGLLDAAQSEEPTMNTTSFAVSLGPVLLLSVFGLGCVSATEEETEQSEAALVTYRVKETEASDSGWGLHATYFKQVRVEASGGPVKPSKVIAAIYRNVATGPRGLCPTCTSATPESEQNNAEHIEAEGVVPGGLWAPDFLKGRVASWRTGASTGRITMENGTNSLEGKITAYAVSPNEVIVEEAGDANGPFAGTLAERHNVYFDLRSAIERELR
jgi:hypothetical protein